MTLRDRIVHTRLVVETIMSVNTNVQSIRLRGSGQISTTNHGGRVMSIRNLHGLRPRPAYLADIPADDQSLFWCALGCNCWMA